MRRLHVVIIAVAVALQVVAGTESAATAAQAGAAQAQPAHMQAACNTHCRSASSQFRRFLQQPARVDTTVAHRPSCWPAPAAQTARHASTHGAPASSLMASVARLLQEKIDKWDKTKDRDTIANAYASQKGSDPTGPGDAFTFEQAEASGATYNGVYYNDGGKATQAGDMAKGQWVGAYSKGIPDNHFPNGVASAIASNFDTEMSSQRGPMAIAGTYEGARATAGSSAWWNLAQKDSIGGAVSSAFIETDAPTPGKPTLVMKRDDPFGRRSVAFTNIAPNSAAQSGAGNGPAAVAAGYEVAASARASRDRKTYRATIGHREEGENGVLDDLKGRRLLRRRLGC